MPKSHTHWPDGKGPTCPHPTKRECDEHFREWKAKAKADYDAAQAERKRIERERQQQAADDFMKKEWFRMNRSARRISLR